MDDYLREDVAAGIGYVDGLEGRYTLPKLYAYWSNPVRMVYLYARMYGRYCECRNIHKDYFRRIIKLCTSIDY